MKNEEKINFRLDAQKIDIHGNVIFRVVSQILFYEWNQFDLQKRVTVVFAAVTRNTADHPHVTLHHISGHWKMYPMRSWRDQW